MKNFIDKSLLLRQDIRNYMRFRRNSLTFKEQFNAAKKITNRILSDSRIQKAKNLSVFFSFDGEIDTSLLIKAFWNEKKNVYLPVLHPFTSGYLLFFSYTPSTKLIFNRFRIKEPLLDITTLLPIKKLDILFVPLVAFDRFGHRLGMGGGFYDRILQNNKYYNFYTIGIAHDFQKTEKFIPIKKWDIPLLDIITPSNHWSWK